MSEKKYENERKQLIFEPKNGYERVSSEDLAALDDYCGRYIDFMNLAKTERECVEETIRQAKAKGFRPYLRGDAVKAGDKLYRVNRDKAVIFAVIGEKALLEGANIVAAHIDSPRLDLKPRPLYEDSELAFLKTHYYGGIKKYQWTAIPLALHGVVVLKDGRIVSVNIGEKESDPVFTITDLLIHLAGDQMKKALSEGISGEALNVLFGSKSLPDDEGGSRVKFAVMKLLNEQYGIVEEDFLSAELSLVPAFKAKEVGFDRSLIGAYGHDDRVCGYASFAALLDLDVPERTAVCVLADKEEIGSQGVTGLQSQSFETFMSDLCDMQKIPLKSCFERSCCLSADVTNAYDPNYAEVSELRNNAKANYGLAICKYSGARGKSGTSDASAELMAKMRRLFDAAEVIWQTAELGKVDQGGGGTVAAYMANRDIDTIDAGVPVLSMHAPYEVVSKLDTYMMYKGALAFYKEIAE